MPDALLDSLSCERRRASWNKTLSGEDSETRVWLLERDGHLVGFVACGRSREPAADGAAEIYAIYQEESVAGTGVGGALFEHALRDLSSRGYERVVLWVLESNSRARKFYERFGMTFDGGQKTETIEGNPLRHVRYCGLRSSHQAMGVSTSIRSPRPVDGTSVAESRRPPP